MSNEKCIGCKFYNEFVEFSINGCIYGASADDREEEKKCEEKNNDIKARPGRQELFVGY